MSAGNDCHGSLAYPVGWNNAPGFDQRIGAGFAMHRRETEPCTAHERRGIRKVAMASGPGTRTRGQEVAHAKIAPWR